MIVALTFVTKTTSAQTPAYPAKPIRVIVSSPSGGSPDILTRILAQKLSDSMNQQVIVDNRAGAGGNIGGELATKAPPDGYTLFMTSGSIVTANQHIYKNMPFDPARDLIAITNVASGPQVLVVTPSFPPQTIKAFVALAKARPHEITYGSAGFSTQTHLAAENFIAATGIDVIHVPYKGEAPAIADVMGGQVQFSTANMAAVVNFIQQGKLRALGVTSKKRSAQLPGVPAIAESIPGFENIGWFGLMVAAGTPREVVEKIYRDTAKALDAPEIKARFEGLGMSPVGNSPADFAKAIGVESVHWARIVRERKLLVE